MLHALIPKRIPNNAIIIVPRKSRYVWINPTYLIVEEVSKTIEIINSRMYLYKAKALVQLYSRKIQGE